MIRYCFVAALLLFGSPSSLTHAAPLLAEYQFNTDGRGERPMIFVPKLSKHDPFKIDGRLDERAWSECRLIKNFDNETGDVPPTTLRVGYDDDYIYFGFTCKRDGKDLNILGKRGERDGSLWGGDCLDIIFGTGKGPAQVVITPSGAWSDSLKGDMAWNPQSEVAASVVRNIWTVEYKLKYGELWMPRNPEGRWLSIAVGRASSEETLQTLTKPYAGLDYAPRFVFGDEAAYRAEHSRRMFSRGMQLSVYMDREEYPRHAERGLGRARIWSGGGAALSSQCSMVMAVMKDGRDVRTQKFNPLESKLIDFELDLKSIPVGEYTFETRLLDSGKVFKRTARRLVIREESAPTAGRIELTVPASPAPLDAYGLTFGVPMPWGALKSANNVRLIDDQGAEIPMQAEVTSRWSRNGHVRWLLIDAAMPMRTEPQRLWLEYGSDVSRKTPSMALTVNDDGKRITVDTGALQFEIPRTNTPGLAQVVVGSELLKDNPLAGPYMIDDKGTLYLGSRDTAPQAVVEAAGPIKAQVSVTGYHVSESGKKLGKFILRYTAYRGVPHIKLDHTFIITEDAESARYKDIGYALPTYTRRGYFGAPRITPFTLSGADDSAYLIQLDGFHGKIYKGGKFVDEFHRADGWFNAGSVTITMRDFWQNFPKEFEAKQDRAIVHFWPGHGEAPLRTPDRLSERNAYQHWFAHEGEILDFKVPEHVVAFCESEGYRDAARKASPIGLSKTHQMLLHFGTWNWEAARAVSTSRVFQSNPTVTCDPQWLCDSKVFGDIGPSRPDKYPELERAIDGTMATIARQNDEDRDYGMWCFGDAHHNWNWLERRVRLYRTWRQTHHNWPRWPWLQYVRSGDKTKFDYASRNMRNVVDVAHAHYASSARYPALKLVGGVCDYKGFVKWAAGSRLGYNSVADALLLAYYFTGDRRALDTAVEHCKRILELNRTPSSREGSARIMSLVEYYMHTWDNDALELLERHVDNYVKEQRPDGVIESEPVLPFWTPGFIRYADLTRAERGRLLTLRWANLICETDPEKRLYPHQQMVDMSVCSVLASLAQAYLYTGDEKYLRMARTRALRFHGVIYDGDDPRYQGVTGSWTRNLPWSWFLMDSAWYSYALDRHGEPVAPADMPLEHYAATLRRMKIDSKEWNTLHARLRQNADKPFTIHLTPRRYEHILEIAPVDVRGKVIRVEAKPMQGNDKMEVIHIEVPSDRALEYAVRIRSAKSYEHINLPLVPDEDMAEVYPVMVSRKGITFGGGEWFYFNIPPSDESARLELTSRAIAEAELRDAAGRHVDRKIWIGANGAAVLQAPVVGNRDGWSIRFRGNQGRGRAYLRSQNTSPMYLAVSPEKIFTPSVDDWQWP